MKRTIFTMFIFVALSGVLVFSLNSISGQNLVEQSMIDSPESLTNVSENDIDSLLFSSGENFKLFDVTKDYKPEYIYEIYNNYGEMVKRETVVRYPTITYLSDSLLSITVGVGTGLWWTQYYDTNQDIFSEIFDSPLEVQDYKVAYIIVPDDTYKLIVRDIFDETKYYREFPIDDFSPVGNPTDALISVKFLDAESLEITYRSGEDYIEKSRILQL